MPASFWEKHRDRVFTVAILFLILYSAVRNIFRAAVRPFWMDEICTWIVARQSDISSIWRALASAADGNPPTYYLVVRFFDFVVSNDQIAFRVPSILAFCFAEWCLFVWLRRRFDSSVAFVASLLPILTTFFGTYAVEARPYAVLLAFFAIALLAYQRAEKTVWIVVLALSLIGAECSHYYAVFFFPSFFLAEAVYVLRTRSIRRGVWLAICSGVLPLVAFWPLLAQIKSYYVGHAWFASATLNGTLKVYGWFFGLSSESPGAGLWIHIAALILAGAVLASACVLLWRSARAIPAENPSFNSDALISGFLLSPILLYVATRISHAGLIPRYLMPVLLGTILVSGFALNSVSRRSLALIGTLLCFSIVIQEAGFWFSYYESYQLGFSMQPHGAQLILSAGHSDLPVVASAGEDYLELAHYTKPPLQSRMTFVADPSAAVAYGRADSTDRSLLALRKFAPLRVVEYASFSAATREFLLYSDPSIENTPDWFTLRLLNDHWTLQKLATDGHANLYLVTRIGDSR